MEVLADRISAWLKVFLANFVSVFVAGIVLKIFWPIVLVYCLVVWACGRDPMAAEARPQYIWPHGGFQDYAVGDIIEMERARRLGRSSG